MGMAAVVSGDQRKRSKFMPKGKIRKRIIKKDPFFQSPNVTKRVTRSDTKPKRDQKRQALVEQVLKEAKELEEKRAKALAEQPPAPAGQCKAAKLHLAFAQIGQDDCTLIPT